MKGWRFREFQAELLPPIHTGIIMPSLLIRQYYSRTRPEAVPGHLALIPQTVQRKKQGIVADGLVWVSTWRWN